MAEKGEREKRDSKAGRARQVRGKSVSLVSLLRVSCTIVRQSAVHSGESEGTYERLRAKETERTEQEKLDTARSNEVRMRTKRTDYNERDEARRRGRYSRKGYKGHEP